MKIKCYFPTCNNHGNFSVLFFIYACLKTQSFHPYVCREHQTLWDEMYEYHMGTK